MAASIIDQFIDGLSEDWMRSVFIDRLENARLLVDDDTFGDKTGANDLQKLNVYVFVILRLNGLRQPRRVQLTLLSLHFE